MDGELRFYCPRPIDDGDDWFFDSKGQPCCGSERQYDGRPGDRAWNAEADAAEGEWLRSRER